MTNYARGSAFEREVKKDLQRHGWIVTKSAGSKGLWDLKAVAPGPKVCLVQCKRDGRMGIEERRALVLVALSYDCLAVLAYKDNGIQYSELVGDEYEDWTPYREAA